MVDGAADERSILEIHVVNKEEKWCIALKYQNLLDTVTFFFQQVQTSNMYSKRNSGPSVETLELLEYILIQMTTVTKNSENHLHCFRDVQYVFHQLLEDKYPKSGLDIFIWQLIVSGMSIMQDVDQVYSNYFYIRENMYENY